MEKNKRWSFLRSLHTTQLQTILILLYMLFFLFACSSREGSLGMGEEHWTHCPQRLYCSTDAGPWTRDEWKSLHYLLLSMVATIRLLCHRTQRTQFYFYIQYLLQIDFHLNITSTRALRMVTAALSYFFFLFTLSFHSVCILRNYEYCRWILMNRIQFIPTDAQSQKFHSQPK